MKKEEHIWTRVPPAPEDASSSAGGGFAAVCSCGAKSKVHETFTDLFREITEHDEGGAS